MLVFGLNPRDRVGLGEGAQRELHVHNVQCGTVWDDTSYAEGVEIAVRIVNAMSAEPLEVVLFAVDPLSLELLQRETDLRVKRQYFPHPLHQYFRKAHDERKH